MLVAREASRWHLAAWHKGTARQRAQADSLQRATVQLVLCLRLADVDQPGDAKLVDGNAELIAPGLLLHRHRGVSAGGQLLPVAAQGVPRSEEHTSELQSLRHLVCRLLLEKKKKKQLYCTLPKKSSILNRQN